MKEARDVAEDFALSAFAAARRTEEKVRAVFHRSCVITQKPAATQRTNVSRTRQQKCRGSD
jgi:hypothetical protein